MALRPNPLDAPPSRCAASQRYLTYATRSGARWLVPRDIKRRAAGLQMYVPYNVGGHVRKAFMLLGVGGRPAAGDDHGFACLEELVIEVLERDDLDLTWFVASPGVVAKTSVLALDRAGRAVAFAKLATVPAARASLDHERAVLAALADAPEYQERAPRPLRWLEHADATVLVSTPAPSRRAPATFGPRHAEYLAGLARRFSHQVPFTSSALWRRLERATVTEGLVAASPWRERVEAARAHLETALRSEVVPVTLAHRDFAPWNTRLGATGLFTFDWEFAAWDYPLNHDFFHFRFMVGLLLRGGVGPRAARAWLAEAPVSDGRNAHYLVAYLLDLALQYLDYQHLEGRSDEDPVLRQAGRLLDAMLARDGARR
jgi:hypothetical protein